jgi:hypothetical protein
MASDDGRARARGRRAGSERALTTGRPEQEEDMADVVFIGLTLVFFALSWGLVRVCERL